MSEDELQTMVIQLAEWLGYRVYHVANVKGQLRNETSAGFPDLVLSKAFEGEHLTRHVVLIRELKSDTGKCSDEQIAWLRASNGQVWRPRHWDLIEKTLRTGNDVYETERV